jgi:hypothetical protein
MSDRPPTEADYLREEIKQLSDGEIRIGSMHFLCQRQCADVVKKHIEILENKIKNLEGKTNLHDITCYD